MRWPGRRPVLVHLAPGGHDPLEMLPAATQPCLQGVDASRQLPFDQNRMANSRRNLPPSSSQIFIGEDIATGFLTCMKCKTP